MSGIRISDVFPIEMVILQIVDQNIHINPDTPICFPWDEIEKISVDTFIEESNLGMVTYTHKRDSTSASQTVNIDELFGRSPSEEQKDKLEQIKNIKITSAQILQLKKMVMNVMQFTLDSHINVKELAHVNVQMKINANKAEDLTSEEIESALKSLCLLIYIAKYAENLANKEFEFWREIDLDFANTRFSYFLHRSMLRYFEASDYLEKLGVSLIFKKFADLKNIWGKMYSFSGDKYNTRKREEDIKKDPKKESVLNAAEAEYARKSKIISDLLNVHGIPGVKYDGSVTVGGYLPKPVVTQFEDTRKNDLARISPRGLSSEKVVLSKSSPRTSEDSDSTLSNKTSPRGEGTERGSGKFDKLKAE